MDASREDLIVARDNAISIYSQEGRAQTLAYEGEFRSYITAKLTSRPEICDSSVQRPSHHHFSALYTFGRLQVSYCAAVRLEERRN